MESPEIRQVGVVFNGSKRLVVPIYQRTYEWTVDDQVAPLAQQIIGKANIRLSPEPQPLAHYMGALITIPRGGYAFGTIPIYDVVDGQQRLTTLQIMLAALQDLARAHGFEGIAAQIRPLLFNTDTENMKDEATEIYKLEPTRYDRQLFRDLLKLSAAELREGHPTYFYQNGNPDPGAAPKSLLAYWSFRESAKDFIFQEGDEHAGRRFRVLVQALLEDFRLIVITLGKDDDAQVIFETLNFRGKPLAAMDLVRNDIFHRAVKKDEDPEQLMERRWKAFEEPFWKQETAQGRIRKPRIDFFLAHTLAAETGKEALLSELYAAYKGFAASQGFATVDAELATLLKHAPTYKALEQLTAKGALGELAQALEAFDISTAYPLVFAIAASGLPDEEKTAQYHLLESYIVRRALCGLTAKNYNKTFVDLAGYVKRGAQTLGQSFLQLKGPTVKFPTNDELIQAIATRAQYGNLRQERLRYILGQLEHLSRDAFDEVEGLKPGLQIEHVLPDSWMEHWPLADGWRAPPDLTTVLDPARREAVEAREKSKHTLGNLTLLTAPANKEVLNYAFDPSKKDRLRQSLLRLNQDIANEPLWDEQAIAKRARRLSELAILRWPAP